MPHTRTGRGSYFTEHSGCFAYSSGVLGLWEHPTALQALPTFTGVRLPMPNDSAHRIRLPWKACARRSCEQLCRKLLCLAQQLHFSVFILRIWALPELCCRYTCAWPWNSLILTLTGWCDFLAWPWTCHVTKDLSSSLQTRADPGFCHWTSDKVLLSLLKCSS